MVKFERIDIESYKSIIKGTLFYKKGVWHLVGHNNDAFASNGAGKSTAIEAIQQCLFNRTAKGLTIDTAANKYTGKSYNLTVYFLAIDGCKYKVNNNRVNSKLTIYKEIDGEFVDVGAKSTPTALTLIQSLIGMDFSTFIALTHVTHSTIVDMVSNFTSSNLMKIVLDFGTLAKFDKKIKDSLKKSSNETTVVSQRKSQAESSLRLLGTFHKIDTSETKRKLLALGSTRDELQDTMRYADLENSLPIQTAQEEIRDKKLRIRTLQNKLDTKVCPECDTELDIDVKDIQARIKVVQGALSDQEIVHAHNMEQHCGKQNKRRDSLDKILAEGKALEHKLSVDDYNNDMYSKAEGDINELKSIILSCEKELPELYLKQDIYQEAIQHLKSGVLHKELIQNFCAVYNVYINDLLQYVSIDSLVIKAQPKKNSIEFLVHDKRFNQDIQMAELSGGELTRVRVVLLLAIIKAIQTLTKVSVNLLVFDESLDTLDSSATEDLAKLFEYLVQSDDKFIALVSHGTQLESIDFTGTITLTKTDGISTISQEV